MSQRLQKKLFPFLSLLSLIVLGIGLGCILLIFEVSLFFQLLTMSIFLLPALLANTRFGEFFRAFSVILLLTIFGACLCIFLYGYFVPGKLSPAQIIQCAFWGLIPGAVLNWSYFFTGTARNKTFEKIYFPVMAGLLFLAFLTDHFLSIL